MMKTHTNSIEIKICNSVIQVMKRHIQIGDRSLEAGGVLIGKENISDNNIIIRYITEPYRRDKRRYSRFIRKDERHIEIYNDIFISSNRIYRYIGEWHTHDEDLPNYSILDAKNWEKIMKEMPEMIEHFHIIVGINAFRIWKVGQSLTCPELIKTIYWKGVIGFDEENCRYSNR